MTAIFGPFQTPLPTAFRPYIEKALLESFWTPPPLPTAGNKKMQQHKKPVYNEL